MKHAGVWTGVRLMSSWALSRCPIRPTTQRDIAVLDYIDVRLDCTLSTRAILQGRGAVMLFDAVLENGDDGHRHRMLVRAHVPVASWR